MQCSSRKNHSEFSHWHSLADAPCTLDERVLLFDRQHPINEIRTEEDNINDDKGMDTQRDRTVDWTMRERIAIKEQENIHWLDLNIL